MGNEKNIDRIQIVSVGKDDTRMKLSDIRIDEKELLKVLQDLIRIESVNPDLAGMGNGEGPIAEHIGKYLAEMGLAGPLSGNKTKPGECDRCAERQR